jgi:hypothetical protein
MIKRSMPRGGGAPKMHPAAAAGRMRTPIRAPAGTAPPAQPASDVAAAAQGSVPGGPSSLPGGPTPGEPGVMRATLFGES